MRVKRRVMKFAALPLAAAGLAAGTAIGAAPVGAQSSTHGPCTTTTERGYPKAVPPILPRQQCSELPAIARAEAFSGRRFWYDPPASARYSNAEMNAYTTEHK